MMRKVQPPAAKLVSSCFTLRCATSYACCAGHDAQGAVRRLAVGHRVAAGDAGGVLICFACHSCVLIIDNVVTSCGCGACWGAVTAARCRVAAGGADGQLCVKLEVCVAVRVAHAATNAKGTA